MRRTPLFLGSAVILGASLGCSETPPPVAPVTPDVKPAQVAAPPVTLDPVAEPADIFVIARWKNPNVTLSGLTACAGVPDSLAENNARLLVDRALGRALRGGADSKAIADIVALDAPVDLVVSLDTTRRTPQALYSFSIGLTSLDRAKQAVSHGGELVELAPGLYRVGAPDQGDLACVVGPAAGSAPARLICGRREKDITTLAPYLARNVPVTEPPKHDVHAELRFGPIDARYGNDLRRGVGFLPTYARTQAIGDPRFDQALEEGARALADEAVALANDLDRLSVDLGVDPKTCLTAKTGLQLKSKTSWLAGAIVDGGARTGPPPSIFWRAPIDSASASYGRGTDAARYQGIFRTLRGLLEGKLAKEQVGSEADRKALAALINLPIGKDTSVVVASGPGAPAKPAAAGTKLGEQQIVDELMGGYLGWSLLGFDEGPEGLTKLMKDLVATYGRKGLTDPLRKGLGQKAKALPAVKLVTPPKELGRGGLDLELKFEIDPKGADKAADKQADKKKPVSFALHALLMPDGKNTWIAVGANRDELVKHLKMVKAGAPDSGTIMAREGLEPLRSGRAVSSGFLTLSMITKSFANLLSNPAFTSQMSSGQSSSAEEIARALNALPHKGDTPIFVTTEAQPGDAPKSELTLQVQKGSLEDLGVILMSALRLANKAGVLQTAQP